MEMLKRLSALMMVALLALTMAACDDDDADDVDDMDDRAAEMTPAALGENDPAVVKISVPSMHCSDCAMAITTACEAVEGTEGVDVRVDEKVAFVKVANNTPAMEARLVKALNEAGFETGADVAAGGKSDRCATGKAKKGDACCATGKADKEECEGDDTEKSTTKPADDAKLM